ncbi:MAG TPA: Mut7-C RNAse domain-containing protein [Streptosporangiaceae bacterium]|nr:Mut7-C RNAse domain-containing protein [Streptosporangiaceae bacterium]
MDEPELSIRFAPELRMFLAPRDRQGHQVEACGARVALDATSTLGHLVEACGVPLPEVGRLVVGGRAVAPSYRPANGDDAYVDAVARPQRLPGPPRFVLDVHLGALARRLRLVGVDAAYRNDLDDDALIAQANAEQRVLLTKDRGLLRRRRLWLGAYVRGDHPDRQLADMLDRFAPRLAPWTRCTTCNGVLEGVPKSEVEHLLRPGTRRTYDAFARCTACGRVYWPGAHHGRLAEIVRAAEDAERRFLAPRRAPARRHAAHHWPPAG